LLKIAAAQAARRLLLLLQEWQASVAAPLRHPCCSAKVLAGDDDLSADTIGVASRRILTGIGRPVWPVPCAPTLNFGIPAKTAARLPLLPVTQARAAPGGPATGLRGLVD